MCITKNYIFSVSSFLWSRVVTYVSIKFLAQFLMLFFCNAFQTQKINTRNFRVILLTWRILQIAKMLFKKNFSNTKFLILFVRLNKTFASAPILSGLKTFLRYQIFCTIFSIQNLSDLEKFLWHQIFYIIFLTSKNFFHSCSKNGKKKAARYSEISNRNV